MAIPDFQTLMLPQLEYIGDGAKHTNQEVLEHLSQRFKLTDKERQELLPSGGDTLMSNRIAWARAHMKRAGLLENTKRGVFLITDQGLAVLAGKPERIDIKFLRQFPGYGPQPKKDGMIVEPPTSHTPEEQLEEAFESLRDNLANELLSQLKGNSPGFFERVVVEVLVKMGYGGSRKDAGQAIGRSGDEGIDGIIKEDRLGLDIIYIQAKRWDSTVGRKVVQEFAGALQGKRARKGVLITTGDFSKGAREYAGSIDSKIILIDGAQLTQLMIDNNVGVATEAVYEIKRLDSDYFAEI